MLLGSMCCRALVVVCLSCVLAQHPAPKSASGKVTLNKKKVRQGEGNTQHLPQGNVTLKNKKLQQGDGNLQNMSQDDIVLPTVVEAVRSPFETFYAAAGKIAGRFNAHLEMFTAAAAGKAMAPLAALKRQPMETSSAWSAQANSASDPSNTGTISSSIFVLGVVSPVGFGFWGFFLWLLLTSMFAWWYEARGGKATVTSHILSDEVSPLVEFDVAKDFRYGFFTCFHVPKLFLFSCCCGAVQWADNVRTAGLHEFYIAICLVFVLGFFGCFTSSLTYVIAVGVYTYHRQQVRKKLNLPCDAKTVAEDFCAYCCCQVCALTQEAREVQFLVASKSRPVETSCCSDGILATPKATAEILASAKATPNIVKPPSQGRMAFLRGCGACGSGKRS